MAAKNYTGYKSYQYLEEGTDYKSFKMVKEIDRVPGWDAGLSADQQARVDRFLDQHPVISLHDHMMVMPEDVDEIWEHRRQGRDWTGYEGLAASRIDAFFENFMDGTACITSRAGWKWEDIIFDIGMRYSDLAHQEMIYRAETVADVENAKGSGRIAMIPTLEAATAIENEVDRVDILFGLGIRCMGLVYSESNALGSGLRERRDGGLTDFGHKVVERMNKLGMTIDTAHCGDQTTLDAIHASQKPIFITHAGARALWDTPRMFPDEVLTALAERGGVIGIEAAPHTTLTRDHQRHSIESVMQHVAYCIDLMGVDHVALGPDTMFGDHVQLHRVFSAHLSIGRAHGTVEYPRVEYVAGFENPVEAMQNAVKWLVKHDYSDTDIAKVIGGNILRVLKETWYR
jgi:membrane dipeptidase